VPSEPSDHGYSDDQLDGLACVDCGERGGPMVPLPEDGPRGQLFRHLDDCRPDAERDRGLWESEHDG
jgi:hypothetical protein